mmetsp:Transcript_8222/g.10750  ORF Transcript_8222/g.10750 Transcript_8222/m.10750 type:complete len:305 (-) Transcript_8222:890-1804(-)
MAINPLSFIKRILSMMLLIYSIVTVSVMIFEDQTIMADQVGSAIAFTSMVLSLIWLSLVEGSQPCMVGLPPVDKSLYKESHPISYKICSYCHTGDNLDRFLMGRQFMVLALVFVINAAGTPVDDVETRTEFSSVMIRSGLALILITAMIGQLNSQVLASHCMLDYVNNYLMTVTLYAAMAIEASGLLHSAYLIQFIFSWLSGSEIPTNEPPREKWQKAFFWLRVIGSLAILVLSSLVVLLALFDEKTSMWENVPMIVTVVLFIGLMLVVGMLEGMQIAFFFSSARCHEPNQCQSMGPLVLSVTL